MFFAVFAYYPNKYTTFATSKYWIELVDGLAFTCGCGQWGA